MEELKCKICGKLASEDCNFNKKRSMCNRHNLQWLRYGEIRNIDVVKKSIEHRCFHCGSIIATGYKRWDKNDKYKGKSFCEHHYRQLEKYGYFLDNDIELVTAGTLGDGHIDRRKDQPMYIETHAEDEKEYIFWKYSFIKDICNQEPVYYPAEYHNFGTDKEYLCQPHYRINTKIIDELGNIRDIPRIEKIKNMTPFMFCLHILDDGHHQVTNNRTGQWTICLAEWTDDEVNEYIKLCRNKLNLDVHKLKDNRYAAFDTRSSSLINEMIMKYVPENLDIIRKKKIA